MRRAAAITLTIAALLLGSSCSDDPDAADDDPTTTTTTAPDASSTTATTAESTSTTLTPFPPQRTSLEHGGEAWAVVLAVVPGGDVESPEITAAVAAADAAGYRTGPGDAGCDEGAAEALGVDDSAGAVSVSVHLEDEAAAEQALRAFRERGFDGGAVARLQTYCMD